MHTLEVDICILKTCLEVIICRAIKCLLSSLANNSLASPANFIYGRVLAKVLSQVTIMPVLLRPVNNFLGQVIGNASEGKYNTVNNSSSGELSDLSKMSEFRDYPIFI